MFIAVIKDLSGYLNFILLNNGLFDSFCLSHPFVYFIIQTLDMMESNEWLEWLFFKGKIVYTLMKTNT